MNPATVATLVRKLGVKKTSHTLTYRALERSVGYMALVGCVTRADQLAYPRDVAFPDDCQGRFLSYDELRDFARVPANDMDHDFLDEAESRGDRCYGVIDRDRRGGPVLASYGWYTHRPFAISRDLTLHFDERYAFVYKCLTQPEYRGKRLHGIGMARAIYELTDAGGAGIVAYVHSRNYNSLRSGQKMGHHEFGVVRVARIAGRYVSMASPGCAPYRFHVALR